MSVRSQEHVKICEQVAVGAQREASRTPDAAMEPTPQFPAVPPQSLPFRRTLNICIYEHRVKGHLLTSPRIPSLALLGPEWGTATAGLEGQLIRMLC